jgi:hypothetical protein
LAAMSFAYESGKAETLKHVLKQVEKDEWNQNNALQATLIW